MLKSKFVTDILELLLDGDNHGIKAKTQIKFLIESDYEYTGSGVFIKFSSKSGIEKYRFEKEVLVLDGVEIKSPELENCADCILHFSNGIIDYLEVWNKGGTYPNAELQEYELTQTWQNSPQKSIKTK